MKVFSYFLGWMKPHTTSAKRCSTVLLQQTGHRCSKTVNFHQLRSECHESSGHVKEICRCECYNSAIMLLRLVLWYADTPSTLLKVNLPLLMPNGQCNSNSTVHTCTALCIKTADSLLLFCVVISSDSAPRGHFRVFVLYSKEHPSNKGCSSGEEN